MQIYFYFIKNCASNISKPGAQFEGDLGENTRPRGRNFALYCSQGEVGVSLKKQFFFFFFFFFKFSSRQHTIDKL